MFFLHARIDFLKILEVKHTIYFGWPKVSCEIILSGEFDEIKMTQDHGQRPIVC